MPKYTKKRLIEMAQQWVVDYTAGGKNSFCAMLGVSTRVGMSPAEVSKRIHALAQEQPDA